MGAGVAHSAEVLDMPVDPNEPTYCLCNQVSYGEMIGCDNPDVSTFVVIYHSSFLSHKHFNTQLFHSSILINHTYVLNALFNLIVKFVFFCYF